MPPAPDLDTAAMLTNEYLTPLWFADTLQAKVAAFAAQLGPSFSDGTPGDRPIGGWLAVIASFAPSILAFDPNHTNYALDSITTFQQAVDYVYRLCRFATFYTGISAAQQQDILDAFNDNFA